MIEFLNPKRVSNPFLPICFPGHAVRSTCTESSNTKTGLFSFFRSVYGSACDAVPKWSLGLRYRCLNWVSTCAVLPGGGLDVISRYLCIYISIYICVCLFIYIYSCFIMYLSLIRAHKLGYGPYIALQPVFIYSNRFGMTPPSRHHLH